jgi:uncharacterized protein YktA (UPF0223 family)
MTKSPRVTKAPKAAPVTNLEAPQIEEVPVKDEETILKEIDDAESTLQLKQIAQKYPLFEKLVPDLGSIKAFNNLYEQMLGYLEPKIVKAKKAPKAPKVPVPSAYGTALELMCMTPSLTFQELKVFLKDKGFTKDSACRTAHVTVKKVFNLLQTNGYIK